MGLRGLRRLSAAGGGIRAAALALRAGIRKKRRVIRVIAAWAVILAAAAIVGSGAVIRASARGRTYSDISAIPHRRVGLLLGCLPRLANGRPNLFFTNRIEAAVRLFTAGKVDYLLVSGENSTAAYNETRDMRRALVEQGIPETRITCDYAGFRTLDSVVRARAVFGQTSITVISQEFHNQRAIYIARHRGVNAIGFNAEEVRSHATLGVRLREQLARVRVVLDVWFGTRPRFLGPRIELSSGQPPRGRA